MIKSGLFEEKDLNPDYFKVGSKAYFSLNLIENYL